MDISIDPQWVPSACTLPTSEQPLRVAEFDALFGRSVYTVERLAPTRLRLALDFSPAVAAQAADLAARENGCCSFFTFTLTIADGSLTLEAAVPDQHAAVLDGLQARAGARAS